MCFVAMPKSTTDKYLDDCSIAEVCTSICLAFAVGYEGSNRPFGHPTSPILLARKAWTCTGKHDALELMHVGHLRHLKGLDDGAK